DLHLVQSSSDPPVLRDRDAHRLYAFDLVERDPLPAVSEGNREPRFEHPGERLGITAVPLGDEERLLERTIENLAELTFLAREERFLSLSVADRAARAQNLAQRVVEVAVERILRGLVVDHLRRREALVARRRCGHGPADCKVLSPECIALLRDLLEDGLESRG